MGNIAQTLTKRPPAELPPNMQVNPKGDSTYKIHINSIIIPDEKVSGFEEIKVRFLCMKK